ncbi:MAG: hypothetical protein JWP29_5639 [Rhodoferax sp.]|nr:hypothetical protein [Rhodoferax sp.]
MMRWRWMMEMTLDDAGVDILLEGICACVLE